MNILLVIAMFASGLTIGLMVGHALGYHKGWWERHDMPCPNDWKH